MIPAPPAAPRTQADRLGPREFVAMMALMMALNALAIDAMLPALPQIAGELGAPTANAQQRIITLYFVGLGIGSLVHGPLADRFGRRPVILVSLVGYIVAALASAFAPTWETMLGMRFLHGLMAAAMGVVATAVVRDRSSGDAMAKMMSLIFLIFMVVPIVAPTLGQGILSIATWPAIFGFLAIMGSVMLVWIGLRLPETMKPEDQRPLALRPLLGVWRQVATHRTALAYMAASSIAIGANFGFLNSAQQIIAQTFGAGGIFPYVFAIVAAGIAAANFTNSRLVMRFGARRVSHTAIIAFIIFSCVQLLFAIVGESLWLFVGIVTLNMAMMGFIGANSSSIAMEPFGREAGSASSFQNSVRTLLSAAVGAIIGGAYDGTTVPLAVGYLIAGIVALAALLWGERGRLFTRPNPPHRPLPRAP